MIEILNYVAFVFWAVFGQLFFVLAGLFLAMGFFLALYDLLIKR